MTSKALKMEALLLYTGITCLLFAGASCSKSGGSNVSQAQRQVANAVKPGNVSGTVKGTFLQDSTYYVTGDIVVNKGDTVVFQPGAKIYITGNYNFWLHGNLSSVGTKADPVWFTVQNQAKYDNPSEDPLQDPAYKGLWGGFQGDSTTSFMVFKYTHIEFTGGIYGTAQTAGTANGGYSPAIGFYNINGFLDVEDSWFYGCIDGKGAISMQAGNYNIMRNIFEKVGLIGSEGIVVNSGTTGNIAYNLIMGGCSNGVKVWSKGTTYQDSVCVYNNTIVNGGFRRYFYGGAGNSLGRGGSIDIEQNGKALIYNNLLVNNRVGLRIVGTGTYEGNALVVADTAHLYYGSNYSYGDSLILTNQFYPPGLLTKPQSTDIPNPSAYVPAGYTLGAVYDGTPVVAVGNPKFVKYPLPIGLNGGTYATLDRLAYVTGFDFHLATGSPAIGKGTTSFTIAKTNIPLDPNFGATAINPPGTDIGCYQSNGNGMSN
ncbi:MAG TPA: hypothetical protein VGN00_05500 [Puia sp.]|jgi:hypothetical protein